MQNPKKESIAQIIDRDWSARVVRIALSLAMLAGISIISSNAIAACQVHHNATSYGELKKRMKAWPGNSSDAGLKKAYSNGKCLITKGYHEGGSPCLTGKSSWHIQVVIPGTYPQVTYHVFDYEKPGQKGSKCTTTN